MALRRSLVRIDKTSLLETFSSLKIRNVGSQQVVCNCWESWLRKSIAIFTANEIITNLTQYQLSQIESDLFKAGLYFSIQPDKIWKSEIFTTFEKIHRSFLNNFKSEETKSQIKAHLSYLANSYFYNYKPSPRILRQYRILQNLRKNKDIFITKPDKGNGVVILDWKLYNNIIEEIFSETSKFEKLSEDPNLKREASLRFLRKLKQKNFF